MAYDLTLAGRVRELLADVAEPEEKEMFGGICFMVNDKMCMGVNKAGIMCRIDPGTIEVMLEEPGCTPMEMGTKTMKGFVYVAEDVLRTNRELNVWVQRCLDYNPKAKASKKRK
jgi:TfoX/Sxy family transcriptional regulator of competence genes